MPMSGKNVMAINQVMPAGAKVKLGARLLRDGPGLGDDRLTPDLFRFGASTLVSDVLVQIPKTVDGNYQGADYLSLP